MKVSKMEQHYAEVKPNHDFVGIFFVPHSDGNTLYAVVPRFWNTKLSDELRFFNGINMRILTQNKTTMLPRSEADAVSRQIKQIKKFHSEESVNSEDDEEDSAKEYEKSHFDVSEILKSLLRLCEFYTAKNNTDINFSVVQSGDTLLLVQKIVNILENNLDELTRTYRSSVEKIDSVRGKITTKGMMMMVAQPTTLIECEFQKFDIQSPIYRIFSTTLDLIMMEELPNYLDFIDASYSNLGPRASFLRSKLSMIQSYSVNVALYRVKSLISLLPRTFNHFREVLQLVEIYLSSNTVDISADGESMDFFHITIPTSKTWEKIIKTGLNESHKVLHVKEQQGLKGPWLSKIQNKNRYKNIDLEIKLRDDSVILADAKYAKAKEMPYSGYQFQQFFYLHAYQTENKSSPTHMSLIHPGKPHSIISTLNLAHYLKIDENDIPWSIVQLPFPQIDDLLRDNWETDFFTTMASQLEAILLNYSHF
jgi:5-methylcytosine-specific restriction endonuclease McrBC regulatory subunit McrC